MALLLLHPLLQPSLFKLFKFFWSSFNSSSCTCCILVFLLILKLGIDCEISSYFWCRPLCLWKSAACISLVGFQLWARCAVNNPWEFSWDYCNTAKNSVFQFGNTTQNVNSTGRFRYKLELSFAKWTVELNIVSALCNSFFVKEVLGSAVCSILQKNL